MSGIKYVLGKYFTNRAHLSGYVLDAVQDHILVVAENDIAVFAHDLNDQFLLAQIAQFIEMFNV